MWFGDLFHELGEYVGDDVASDVLAPRMVAIHDELALHRGLRELDRSAKFTEEPSWNWYALSRIYDRLLPSLQEGDGVSALLSELGFEAVRAGGFHPFFHEIVAVEEDAEASDCTVAKLWWPGWLWGSMLFARAGVTVRCPPNTFRPELAVCSPLYFAYARRHRPAQDLSHGWGHNSQWRTSFRRDYVTSNAFEYNVDGRWLIEADEPANPHSREVLHGLSKDARIELLRHRSLVRTPHAHVSDLWPYDDRHVELRQPSDSGHKA